jgi:hypothetical protein
MSAALFDLFLGVGTRRWSACPAPSASWPIPLAVIAGRHRAAHPAAAGAAAEGAIVNGFRSTPFIILLVALLPLTRLLVGTTIGGGGRRAAQHAPRPSSPASPGQPARVDRRLISGAGDGAKPGTGRPPCPAAGGAAASSPASPSRWCPRGMGRRRRPRRPRHPLATSASRPGDARRHRRLIAIVTVQTTGDRLSQRLDRRA